MIKTGDKNQTFHLVEQLNESGIDLHQFAKQVVGFIDKHLLEDIDFYLQVAEMMGEIMRQIRFYPYPAVIYKVALHKFLGADTPCRDASLTRPNPAESGVVSRPTEEPKAPNATEEPTAPNAKDEPVATPQTDVASLRTTILSQLSKPSAQSNLKDHALIEKIENNTVYLVATNRFAEMLLKGADIKKELEDAFTKQFSTPTTISFTFEAKEAYFARTLGL
jgi:hypothetical protein